MVISPFILLLNSLVCVADPICEPKSVSLLCRAKLSAYFHTSFASLYSNFAQSLKDYKGCRDQFFSKKIVIKLSATPAVTVATADALISFVTTQRETLF